MDVFLTKKLMDKLHVFQFPLYGASQRPYDEKTPNLRCRMKPTLKKVGSHAFLLFVSWRSVECSYAPLQVELEVPLDTTSPMYDRVKAEELAQLVCPFTVDHVFRRAQIAMYKCGMLIHFHAFRLPASRRGADGRANCREPVSVGSL